MSTHTADNPGAMAALGAQLAEGLEAVGAGCTVHLQGELGAGKTTLTRGVLHALGHLGRVKSPTYALVESYPIGDGARTLHHLDLYRLEKPEDAQTLGLRDLDPADWVLIEWPEKGVGALPPADLVVRLAYRALGESEGRTLIVEALTPVGAEVVDNAGL